jgi:hypothetical protein
LNTCHSAVEGQNGVPGTDLHETALAKLEKSQNPHHKTLSEDMVNILMINDEEDGVFLGKNPRRKGTSS